MLVLKRKRSALSRALPFFGVALGAAGAATVAILLVPAASRADLRENAKRQFRRLEQTARKLLPDRRARVEHSRHHEEAST